MLNHLAVSLYVKTKSELWKRLNLIYTKIDQFKIMAPLIVMLFFSKQESLSIQNGKFFSLSFAFIHSLLFPLFSVSDVNKSKKNSNGKSWIHQFIILWLLNIQESDLDTDEQILIHYSECEFRFLIETEAVKTEKCCSFCFTELLIYNICMQKTINGRTLRV